MTGENYASGNRHVNACSEDEFIARWQAFITERAKTAPGFGSARLLRDADDPRHFLSFSDWADAASRDAWKASPEFERGLTSSRELCDESVGSDYAQAARL
jgi:heme-degrading monooxygenase HmoA